MSKIIAEHIDRTTLKESVLIPEHEERKESSTFRKSKKRLKEDGHYKCWICENTEHLEVHHFLCSWSMQNVCDYDKLKELVVLFDIYGYGKKLNDIPITSVDDIRNLIVLCLKHHRQTFTGIHELTFPTWILQKVTKADREVVIDEDAV